MFEYFIAKRYLKSKHKLNFITIISLLSTIGITIGVAALVIVLSVFNGFGSLVKSILVNIDPHIKINLISDKATLEFKDINNTVKLNKDIKSFYPYIEGKVIISCKNNYQILNLKGIDKDYAVDNWGLKDKMIMGENNLYVNSLIPPISIGLPRALRLSTRIGDTITVTSINNLEKSLINFSIPKTKKFIIGSVFESNNQDFDEAYAFTSLDASKNLFNLKHKISGYEIYLNDIESAENVKEFLNSKLDKANFSIQTWYDLHKDLYNVMVIERWAAYLLLCLIIAIASFNILASLTMSVIEKKKDIGVLRSMGVNDKSILKIFMFEGILVGLIGTITGLMLGLFVCYMQIYFKFYPMDPTKYIIDALPLEIRIWDLVAIAGMSFLLSFLASVYPAKRAVKLSIIESIKWE
ncbi:MAG: ABC transporter permease [bacterium]